MTLLSGGGAAAFEALAGEAAGVAFDLAHALAIERAAEPCRWAEVNAALMLHADGAAKDDVRAYLRRWGVMGDETAAHVVRFMTDPTSRTYIMNYPAGRALCDAYVGGDVTRLRRLLTEQIRVGDLIT